LSSRKRGMAHAGRRTSEDGVESSISEAAAVLAKCQHAIAFTGAGISVESGIPDFRSPGGLWERFDPVEYAHISTFLRDPERSWEMFLAVEQIIEEAAANAAHRALAELEREGVLGAVVTQNIDGLHQAAGSTVVHEFHGTHAELHCVDCGRRYGRERVLETIPPHCSCGQALKPAVVLFGEAIPAGVSEAAFSDADACDGLLVVGTSALVFPAAQIPYQVAGREKPVIVVDREPTPLTREVSCLYLRGTAGEILPRLVTEIMAKRAGGETPSVASGGFGGQEQVPG